MKKAISLLCAAALIFSLSACGKKAETIDNSAYADQTVTGKVTEINGSVVTLQLGELSESSDRPDAAGSENGTLPAKPDGDSDASGSDGTPPELPSDAGGDASNSGGTPPAKPDGDSDASGSGSTPPEMPSGSGDGNAQSGGASSNGSPFGAQAAQSFTAGDESITADLADASIVKDSAAVSVSDIAEGSSAVSDNAVITVGSGCTWTLTGDCTVTSVTNNGTINFNGYTVTLADGTVLK